MSIIVPDANSLALYHFDEASGATVADASASSNDVTFSGGYSRTAGKYGNAILLDGTDGTGESESTIGISGAGVRTIELWFYAHSVTGNRSLYSFGHGAFGELDELLIVGSKLYWAGYGSDYDVTGGETILVNTPYHVALTYDGATKGIYLNGVFQFGKAMTLATADTVLTIGKENIGTSYFDGWIDELHISNVFRTGEQIARNYIDGLGGSYVWAT